MFSELGRILYLSPSGFGGGGRRPAPTPPSAAVRHAFRDMLTPQQVKTPTADGQALTNGRETATAAKNTHT
jgi:hypothetical protein